MKDIVESFDIQMAYDVSRHISNCVKWAVENIYFYVLNHCTVKKLVVFQMAGFSKRFWDAINLADIIGRLYTRITIRLINVCFGATKYVRISYILNISPKNYKGLGMSKKA